MAEDRQPVSRREFIVVAGLAATGMVPESRARLRRQPAMSLRWETLAPGVRVASNSGGNSLLVVRGDDALLVDSKVAGFGSVLRRESGANIRTVINTHHHGDHAGGNHAFSGTAALVAQARARERIAASATATLGALKGASVDAYANGLRRLGFEVSLTPEARRDVEQFLTSIETLKADAWLPSTTVDRERELRAAGYVVQLTHVTPSHTDNDLIVFLPELNVLHAGDLLFNEHHPFVDTSAGASTLGWDRSLAAAIAMCNAETRVVGGHGPVTDRTGLQRQRNYFDAMRAVVTDGIREGKTRAEVVALRPGAVAGYGFESLLGMTLGVLYDEVTRR